jgi:hypothetical protein
VPILFAVLDEDNVPCGGNWRRIGTHAMSGKDGSLFVVPVVNLHMARIRNSQCDILL